MSRHKYKLMILVVAIAVLAMSTKLSTQGAPVAYAIPCGTNCENVTNTPTVSLTLNGTDQTVSSILALSLNKANAAGWNVTITSTQFQTGTTPTRTLPATASSITGVTTVCTAGQTCATMPVNAITYPLAVPAAGTAPTAVKFYNAAASSGRGTFDVSTTINITVPANTYAGIYTSTITLAFVTGP